MMYKQTQFMQIHNKIDKFNFSFKIVHEERMIIYSNTNFGIKIRIFLAGHPVVIFWTFFSTERCISKKKS